MRRLTLSAVSLLLITGCSGGGAEARARAAAEKVKESMPDVEAKALEQRVTPEQVKRVQEQLQKLNEYLGDVNGTLDTVTVNAIQAFQRAQGIKADGILNEKTERL